MIFHIHQKHQLLVIGSEVTETNQLWTTKKDWIFLKICLKASERKWGGEYLWERENLNVKLAFTSSYTLMTTGEFHKKQWNTEKPGKNFDSLIGPQRRQRETGIPWAVVLDPDRLHPRTNCDVQSSSHRSEVQPWIMLALS